MEVYNTKGVIIMYPLAVFAIMLMILLNGYGCAAAAAVLVKSNTTFRCDGRLDECLIEDDLQFEFLMNPYVSRVLAGGGKGNPLNPNSPFFKECGSAPSYDQCVAELKNPDHKKCVNKDSYSRCPPPKPQ
jgi:hypothetical protein